MVVTDGGLLYFIRWVHVDCERQEGADTQVQDGYTCRVCKQVQEESRHNQPISSQEPSLTDPEPIEGEYKSLSTRHTSDVFVSLVVGSVIEYWSAIVGKCHLFCITLEQILSLNVFLRMGNLGVVTYCSTQRPCLHQLLTSVSGQLADRLQFTPGINLRIEFISC